MKTSTRIATVAAALTASTAIAVALIVSTSHSADPETDAPVSLRPAAITSFPDLEVAASGPWLTSLETASPRPGTVTEAAGPFDDRFEFHDLAFADGVVTGEVLVTSDVSEVLELEVLAGFYDGAGALVDDASFVFHAGSAHTHGAEEEGTPTESYRFEVTMPADVDGDVVSAAVGVPVLVNE